LLFDKKLFSVARNIRYLLVGWLVLPVFFSFFLGSYEFAWGGALGDYLEKELQLINSETVDYNVNKEVSEEYKSLVDNQLHNDPIDIHISILEKSSQITWSGISKTYFAIECKRLNNTVSEYVADIQKFTKRKYIKSRLPYEEQIGFIENEDWNYVHVKDLINENLSRNRNIKTINNLNSSSLDFDASYLSKHVRSHNKQSFDIYHLLLDYSKIVINK
jgi:hypothetical protein